MAQLIRHIPESVRASYENNVIKHGPREQEAGEKDAFYIYCGTKAAVNMCGWRHDIGQMCREDVCCDTFDDIFV